MEKQIVAVGGGKGGVGKSLVASNLAIVMAQLGCRVTLVDADLGGANLHTMFGIDRPRFLLEHFISKKVAKLDEVVIPTAQAGLGIICGGMPILGTANPKHSQKMKLIRHILALDADVVVMDIGAGVGFNVLDLFNAADSKLVVFTSQLTSLHNGYGFLKAAVHRKLQRRLPKELRQFLESTAPESGGESLLDLIDRLARESQEEAENTRVMLAEEQCYLVGNMVKNAKEGQVVQAVGKMVRDHLQIHTPVLGILRYGDKLQRSVNERRPFMLWAGIESNAETFQKMARKLLATRVNAASSVNEQAVAARPIPAQSSTYNRKSPRFPVQGLGAVLIANGQETSGNVCNIAYGGALVVFDQKITRRANGKLVIGPTSEKKTVEVTVAEKHRDPSGMQIGFVFEAVDSSTREGIADLVASAVATTAVSQSQVPQHDAGTNQSVK